ncbi:MAG: hypothetical protein ACYTGQ_06470 [Planctomycetota bacterium]|jgi:hypothetical protein
MASPTETGQPEPSPAVLDQTLRVGPDIDVESWRLNLPARPACFLLRDADDGPILLATVANLRAALARRLAPHEPDEANGSETPAASRRIDYHRVIRSVRYRLVNSPFEADWVYLHNAHRHLPHAFDELTKRFGAHWLHINMADAFPRFVSIDRPLAPDATCFGPLPNAKAAQKLAHALESLLDLCREHRLLLQTPNARACDYKAMGRCPAPCDGTIPLEAYRSQLHSAIRFITHSQTAWREAQSDRMRRAAAEQDFETAQRLKQNLQLADTLQAAPPPLTRFNGVVLATSTNTPTRRAFGFAPGSIAPLGDLSPEPTDEELGSFTDRLRAFLGAPPAPTDDRLHAKHTALVAWHTLHGKAEHRRIITAENAHDHNALRAACAALLASETKPREESSLGDKKSEPIDPPA